MNCKSEILRADVAKALDMIASWCYFNRCDRCPLFGSDEKCDLLTHIPSEYRAHWMDKAVPEKEVFV